ncbi:hypothetical protein K2173_018074 [Erythroxylum novogranatense]|uniref:Pentatricopeptide repeat-containing protein n=1 Tax=Erythroxylum novogranatense TaxID=1862640 RepID=A0AAV8TY18_9ROSI|nr:hypothetical protein K2173_018074 [Erythroxylum novogranatense]
MSLRDLTSWTSMISGYVLTYDLATAFVLFNKMRLEMEPNSVTLIVMLQGCCACGSFMQGEQLHCYVIKAGLLVDVSIQNSILRMYSRMDCIEEAEKVFNDIDEKDVVSWNTLINYHSLRGDVDRVVGCFNQMRGQMLPSKETLTSIVSAFAKAGNLVEGEILHCFSMKVGLCDNILLTSLLDFYAKCGEMKSSSKLFGEISYRSIITWNAMMRGFIQNGRFHEAIELFRQLPSADYEHGTEILGSLLEACMHLGALQLGKEIHAYLVRNFFYISKEDSLHLNTTILNMYIKWGLISSARNFFDRMLVKDTVTWTSMIEGYGIHGLGAEALHLFYQMIEESITPNSVTLVSLLSSCSHSGLINEGCEMFSSMKCKFGIELNLHHYTCLVDLLGRSSKLKEALALILRMLAFADGRIWGALLAASRIHGDTRIGEFAAQRLLELEPDNIGYHILLSNIQACSGKWADVEEFRRVLHEKYLKKTPGWSYFEYKGNCSCFVSGDGSHKQTQEMIRRKVAETKAIVVHGLLR